MIDYQTLLYEKQGHVAKITLNRPEKLNALSGELLAELWEALDDVEQDHDVRVVVLTGNGRAFSSGFDMSSAQQRSDMPATARWELTNLAPRTLMRFWYLRQPTIAAVNGFAVAAGSVLALACDVVLAAEHATFAEPEVRHVAHSPALILPWMMANRHLHWFYLSGDTIDAQTAERWNLVNRVLPAEQLQAEAMRMADYLAQVPPFACQMMKRSIKQAYDHMGFTTSFEQHLTLRMVEALTPGIAEKEALRQIRETQGMHAFLQARDAPFQPPPEP